MSTKNSEKKNIVFSFDVGHSSIGWGVIKSDQDPQQDPEIVDCGVVLFQKDSCLASKRRQYRRMRRNIRATRQRISRLKKLFAASGILSVEKLDAPGHMAPFFLASQFLSYGKKLNAEELWHIVRWYAHNRGYDGNSRWARNEENPEDTDKLKNAADLMSKHGTETMAETISAISGLNPKSPAPEFHNETQAYRIANAAFPRHIIYQEVESILKGHIGQIPGLSTEIVELILKQDELSLSDRQRLKEFGIKNLPKRYQGGLLFGQLVPRFDNRIITRCPVTWANVYDEAIQSGATEQEAKKRADKFSKVPSKSNPSFLRYRLARVIANIRADGRPLSPKIRNQLFELAVKRGSLTIKDIRSEIKAALGDVDTNISNYFELHPDSKDALVFDPALDLARKASENSQNPLYPFFSLFPEALQRLCISRWRKGKSITLLECLDRMEKHGSETSALRQKIEEIKHSPVKGKKKSKDSLTDLEKSKFYPSSWKSLKGRAPYAKPVLEQVVNEVLAGYDSTRPARSDKHPEGEEKTVDGVLYSLLDPSSRVSELTQMRTIDELTNNHLVRHRMLILDRLVREMIKEYADRDPSRVARVIVEVGREVSQFSGKTAKEIQMELNSRLKDFKSAVQYLEKHTPELSLTGGLIRKCRIAMDMGWTCPFTSQKYTPHDLHRMEREHIVPHSNVKTNALHALVLTYPEVNRMKGKRTAWQFIQECASSPVEGRPNLSILTPNIYEQLVKSLDDKEGHDDDRKRKKARKALLMVEQITPRNEKEQDFTMGQMTQSSHLMKLAARSLKLALPESVVSHIPGQINSMIRTSWNTLNCLVSVAPDIIDENGKIRPKDEIRGITHMHHALDALNLAIADHYIPNLQNGALWTALLKRKKNDDEKRGLRHYKLIKFNDDGASFIDDIPKSVKKAMSDCLARERVMQHIPADQGGAITAETTWRILKIEGEGDKAIAHLAQKSSTVENGKRKREKKTNVAKAQKVMGAQPKGNLSKLKQIKGGIMIEGNYGIALDPALAVILHHKVHSQLVELTQKNGGKKPRVIRPYSLIKVKGQGERGGIWIVRSLKDTKRDGVLVDLTRPSFVATTGKGKKLWQNVRISSLLKTGLELVPSSYLGQIQQS